jgi:hypothetical protein
LYGFDSIKFQGKDSLKDLTGAPFSFVCGAENDHFSNSVLIIVFRKRAKWRHTYFRKIASLKKVLRKSMS